MTQDQPRCGGGSPGTGRRVHEYGIHVLLSAAYSGSKPQITLRDFKVYQGQVESLQAQLNGLQAQFMKISSGIAGRIAGLEQELAAIRSLLASALPEGQTGMLEPAKPV